MKLPFAFVVVVLLAVVSSQSAFAGSCSSWKATCMARGRGPSDEICDAKFKGCLSTGCFKEAKKYGGGTHCELTRK